MNKARPDDEDCKPLRGGALFHEDGDEARVSTWGLALWLCLSIVLFFYVPGPPLAISDEGASERKAAIRARLKSWAKRDRLVWEEERGDMRIPYASARGHLAIVIDDLGRELEAFQALHALRYRLTFSILPQSVYALGTQLRARDDPRRPREILLHLPMEPLDAAWMRRGDEGQEDFLVVSDSAAQIRNKVQAALHRVGAATAVNHHMGSRFTTMPEKMAVVFDIVDAHGLYYLDSRTTAESVGVAVARQRELPILERTHFLDHDPQIESIRAALHHAAEESLVRPSIAIAHPSANLARVLAEELDDLFDMGVGVYSLSEILEHEQPQVRLHRRPDDALK